MTEQAVSFKIHGLPELERDLLEMANGVVAEAAKGFVPEARYRGQGGIPFTGDTIELVGKQKGFMVRDGW